MRSSRQISGGYGTVNSKILNREQQHPSSVESLYGIKSQKSSTGSVQSSIPARVPQHFKVSTSITSAPAATAANHHHHHYHTVSSTPSLIASSYCSATHLADMPSSIMVTSCSTAPTVCTVSAASAVPRRLGIRPPRTRPNSACFEHMSSTIARPSVIGAGGAGSGNSKSNNVSSSAPGLKPLQLSSTSIPKPKFTRSTAISNAHGMSNCTSKECSNGQQQQHQQNNGLTIRPCTAAASFQQHEPPTSSSSASHNNNCQYYELAGSIDGGGGSSNIARVSPMLRREQLEQLKQASTAKTAAAEGQGDGSDFKVTTTAANNLTDALYNRLKASHQHHHQHHSHSPHHHQQQQQQQAANRANEVLLTSTTSPKNGGPVSPSGSNSSNCSSGGGGTISSGDNVAGSTCKMYQRNSSCSPTPPMLPPKLANRPPPSLPTTTTVSQALKRLSNSSGSGDAARGSTPSPALAGCATISSDDKGSLELKKLKSELLRAASAREKQLPSQTSEQAVVEFRPGSTDFRGSSSSLAACSNYSLNEDKISDLKRLKEELLRSNEKLAGSEFRGSSNSLAGSSTNFSAIEEKQAQEIRKLKNELLRSSEKISSLTSQLITNVNMVSAFEQSLASMTTRLSQLSLTANEKDREINRLKAIIEQMRQHQLARRHSSDSTAPAAEDQRQSSGSSSGTAIKFKSRSSSRDRDSGENSSSGWLRGSIKHINRFRRSRPVNKVHESCFSDVETSRSSLTINSFFDNQGSPVSPNVPAASPPNDSYTANMGKFGRSMSVLEERGNESLRLALMQKERDLTDTRLEALSTAHKMENMDTEMHRMKLEMESLIRENRQLQRQIAVQQKPAPAGTAAVQANFQAENNGKFCGNFKVKGPSSDPLLSTLMRLRETTEEE